MSRIANLIEWARKLDFHATNKWLVLAAVSEAATGAALLIVPSLVGHLLFGVALTGIAIPLARVAGIALIAFGIACWPGTPQVGMVIYGATVALYLGYVGFADGLTGKILWPVVALHLTLTALLTRTSRSNTEMKPPGLGGFGNDDRAVAKTPEPQSPKTPHA